MFAGLVAKNKKSLFAGASFGLTSGVITTLGILVGVGTITNSMEAVLAGIISVAIADSLSDAMGMHLAKEAEGGSHSNEIWSITFATFATKFLFTIIFILPIIFFDLKEAMVIGIASGFILLSLLSLVITRINKQKPLKPILEHNLTALLVITLTYVVGYLVHRFIS
ncbi:hypothetical protein ACFL24_00945 [Patescibacteria group bacterium]